eukprot:10692235-Alexandrium_andersonii.AAC.1
MAPEDESVPAEGGEPDTSMEPEGNEEEEQPKPRAQIPPPADLQEADRPGRQPKETEKAKSVGPFQVTPR